MSNEAYLVDLFGLNKPLKTEHWDLINIMLDHIELVKRDPSIYKTLAPRVMRFMAQYFYGRNVTDENCSDFASEQDIKMMNLLLQLNTNEFQQGMILSEDYLVDVGTFFIESARFLGSKELREKVSIYFQSFCKMVEHAACACHPICLRLVVSYYYGLSAVCGASTVETTELQLVEKALKFILKYCEEIRVDDVLTDFLVAGTVRMLNNMHVLHDDEQNAKRVLHVAELALDMVQKLNSEERCLSTMTCFLCWILMQFPMISGDFERVTVECSYRDSEAIKPYEFVNSDGEFSRDDLSLVDDDVGINENIEICVNAIRNVLWKQTHGSMLVKEFVVQAIQKIESLRKEKCGYLSICYPLKMYEILISLDPETTMNSISTKEMWVSILSDTALVVQDGDRIMKYYKQMIWKLVNHCFIPDGNHREMFDALREFIKHADIDAVGDAVKYLNAMFLKSPDIFMNCAAKSLLFNELIEKLYIVQRENKLAVRNVLTTFLVILLSVDCGRAYFFESGTCVSYAITQMFDNYSCDCMITLMTDGFCTKTRECLLFDKLCALFKVAHQRMEDGRWQSLILKLMRSFKDPFEVAKSHVVFMTKKTGLLLEIAKIPSSLLEHNKEIFEGKKYDSLPYSICCALVELLRTISEGDIEIAKEISQTSVYSIISDAFSRIEIDELLVEKLLEIVFECDVSMKNPNATHIKNEFALPFVLKCTQHLEIYCDVLALISSCCTDCISNTMKAYIVDVPNMIVDYLLKFPVEHPWGSPVSKACCEAMHLFSVISHHAFKLSTMFKVIQSLRRRNDNTMSWWTHHMVSLLPTFLENADRYSPAFLHFGTDESGLHFPSIPDSRLRSGWIFGCFISIEKCHHENLSSIILEMYSTKKEYFSVVLRGNQLLVVNYSCPSGDDSWSESVDKFPVEYGTWCYLTITGSKKCTKIYVDGVCIFTSQRSTRFTGDVSAKSIPVICNVSRCEMYAAILTDDHIKHLKSNETKVPHEKQIFGYNAKQVIDGCCVNTSRARIAVDNCAYSGTIFESPSSVVDAIQRAGGLKMFLPLLDQVNLPIYGKDDERADEMFCQQLLGVFQYAFTTNPLLEAEFVDEDGFRAFAYAFRQINRDFFTRSLLIAIQHLWQSLTRKSHKREMLKVVWFDFEIWMRMPRESQLYFWDYIITAVMNTDITMFCEEFSVGELVEYISQQPITEVRSKMWVIVDAMSEYSLCEEDMSIIFGLCFLDANSDFQIEALSVLLDLTVRDIRGCRSVISKNKGYVPFVHLMQSPKEMVRVLALSIIYMIYDNKICLNVSFESVMKAAVCAYNSENTGDIMWKCLTGAVVEFSSITEFGPDKLCLICGLAQYFPAETVSAFTKDLAEVDNLMDLCNAKNWYFWLFVMELQATRFTVLPVLMSQLAHNEKFDLFNEGMTFLQLLCFIGYDSTRLIHQVLVNVCTPVYVSATVVEFVLSIVSDFLWYVFTSEVYSLNLELLALHGKRVTNKLTVDLSRIDLKEFMGMFGTLKSKIGVTFSSRVNASGHWIDIDLALILMNFVTKNGKHLRSKSQELFVFVLSNIAHFSEAADSVFRGFCEKQILDENSQTLYSSLVGALQSEDASVWLEEMQDRIPSYNESLSNNFMRIITEIHAIQKGMKELIDKYDYFGRAQTCLVDLKQKQRKTKNLALRAHCRLTRTMSLNGGPWCESSALRHWRLDPRLDIGLRHVLLRPNRLFSQHTDAAMKRDSARFRESKQIWMESNVTLIDPLKEDMVKDYQMPDRISKYQFDAKMVTMCALFEGQFYLTSDEIIFDGDQISNKATSALDGITSKTLKFKLTEIVWILWRAYLHIDQGLEFFLKGGRSYFFFFDNNERDQILKFIAGLKLSNIEILQRTNGAKLAADQKITEKWMSGAISTYEYLMMVNLFAGRSINDLSQYPVFPWVLRDYTSSVLNVDNPLVFRDFTKPVGALNEERKQRLINEMIECPDSPAKCMYRCHYSNAYNVLHFMIRLEPFTSLHISMQDGRFDNPNRLFRSIERSYQLAADSMTNDFRELIPEFFTLPDFLMNKEKFDLGIEDSDVILPHWALSPDDFIIKHRMALESKYVGATINNWIDLVFGYKQRGEEAVKAYNTFHKYCYPQSITRSVLRHPERLLEIQQHAGSFGITPNQIFMTPHPPRPDSVSILPRIVHHPRFHSVLTISNSDIMSFSVSESRIRVMTTDGRFWTQKESDLKSVLFPYSPNSANCGLFIEEHQLFAGCDHTRDTLSVHYLDSLSSDVFSYHQKFTKFLKIMAISDQIVATSDDGSVISWRIVKRKLGDCMYRVNHLYAVTVDTHCSEMLGLAVSCSSDSTIVIFDILSGNFIRSFSVPEQYWCMRRVLVLDSGFIILLKESTMTAKSKKSVIKFFGLNRNDLLGVFEYPSAVTAWVPINMMCGLSFIAVAYEDNHIFVISIPDAQIMISTSVSSTITGMHFDQATNTFYMSNSREIVATTL